MSGSTLVHGLDADDDQLALRVSKPSPSDGDPGGIAHVSLRNPDGTALDLTDLADAATETTLDAFKTEAHGDSTAILNKLIAAPATEAKQDTGNTSLASIKTNTDKLPSLGQGAMAASVPVAIASNQSAVPVSGTVALGAGAAKIGKVTDQPLTGSGQGTTTAGASAVVATGKSGEGLLYIYNGDPVGGSDAFLTFDGTTADNTKFRFPPGASIGPLTMSDVAQVKCFSAGAPPLSWAFFTVT